MRHCQKQWSEVCIGMDLFDSFIWTLIDKKGIWGCTLNEVWEGSFLHQAPPELVVCLFVTGRNKQFLFRPVAWYVVVVVGCGRL